MTVILSKVIYRLIVFIVRFYNKALIMYLCGCNF